MKARKEQLGKLKEAKSNGKVAYFSGRRLVIHDRNPNNRVRIPEPGQSFTPPRPNTVSSIIEVLNLNESSNVTSTPQPGASNEQTPASTSEMDQHDKNQNSRLSQANRKNLRPLTDVNYKI